MYELLDRSEKTTLTNTGKGIFLKDIACPHIVVSSENLFKNYLVGKYYPTHHIH